MKKITFLVAFLMVGAMSVAQIVDRPDNGVNSIIAAEGNDGSGVYCADSFTTTDAYGLTTITFNGTNSNGGALEPFLDSLNVFIYADDGGTPGGQPQVGGVGVIELAEIDAANYTIDNDAAGASTFTVDLVAANGGTAPELLPGTYWMVCFPNVASAPADGAAGRWNWALSDGPAPIDALLIDPQDLFGAGATNWTTLNTLVAGANSFAWTLDGDIVLGVNDADLAGVSIFPNPASEILNINAPASVELTGATLYDVLGKATNLTLNNGQINVASLARGVYILDVQTSAGTLTEKVVIE